MANIGSISANPLPNFEAEAPGAKGALTGSQNMGKEEFLRLLVTQLRNQDPMNPLDGHEFAAQLAQFSSVEQLMNIQKSLETNSEAVGMLASGYSNSVATSMIGKTVEVEGNTVHLSGSDGANIKIDLKTDAAEVAVTIRNAQGVPVREIRRANLPGGVQELRWDGKDHAGLGLPPGRYTYQIKAADASGAAIESRSFSRGVVDRVTFGPEGALLWMGNTSAPMAAVRSVLGQGAAF